MKLEQFAFGRVDGVDIKRFVCANDHGLALELCDYGALVLAVRVPDAAGRVANVSLGIDRSDDIVATPGYFGATVGRFANRIAGGRFELDGETCVLATNNGPNHLHGGRRGFNRVPWQATPLRRADAVGVAFERRSAHGEEGYPGNLDVRVEYLLDRDDRLIMQFEASSDRPTHVNLTNHCFWNLAGAGDILDHRLEIAASRYLPVDETLIPGGEPAGVDGTALDLRSPRRVGDALAAVGESGFDHCYLLDHDGDGPGFAARLSHPPSGRVMSVFTTQPGLQFYSGNFLDGTPRSVGLGRHAALCLEAQHFPDSPNQPGFPSTRLDPGQRYRQRTEHRFSVAVDRRDGDLA